jgi:hypothetical protein
MVKIGIEESGRNLEDFLKKSWMPRFFMPDNRNRQIKNGDNTLFQEPSRPSIVFSLPPRFFRDVSSIGRCPGFKPRQIIIRAGISGCPL